MATRTPTPAWPRSPRRSPRNSPRAPQRQVPALTCVACRDARDRGHSLPDRGDARCVAARGLRPRHRRRHSAGPRPVAAHSGRGPPRVEVSWTALLALLAAVPVAFAGIVSVPPAGSPGVPSPHSSLTNEAMHGASDCWCYCRGHRHCLPAASHQVPSAPASRPRPMATSWSPANSLTLPEVFSVRAGTGRRAASCGDGVARRPTRRPIRVAVESKGAILVAGVVHNLRRPCGNPVNKRGCVSEGSWPARTRPPLAFAAASALQRNPLPLTIHSGGAVPALWRRPASGGLRWQAAQRQAERLGGPGIPGAPARERDASDPGQGTSYKAGRLSGTLSGVSRNPPGCRCHPGLAVAASTTPPATAGRCFGVVS